MKRYGMTLLLCLVVFFVGTNAQSLITLGKSSAGNGGEATEEGLTPSRASIYRHLLTEQENVKGAEIHIKSVFDSLVANTHEYIDSNVLSILQTHVDSVVERAEEAWVNAGNALRTAEVRTCIEGSEGDAQQVAKRAVEKMRGCADALQHEGERRVREATRLLGQIDAVTKRFIGALETCVKRAEAGELADPPLAPAPTEPTPQDDPQPTPAPAIEEETVTEVEDVTSTAPCTKKSKEDKSCSCPKCTKDVKEVEEKEEGLPKQKCKGKCEKGKNRDENPREKVNEKEKRKGKKKREKAVDTENENAEEEIIENTTAEEVKQVNEKKRKGKKKQEKAVDTENENAEEEIIENMTEEVKHKKDKHGKKKESKGKKDKKKDAYETKGRKSRDLLSIEENPEEENESDTPVQNLLDAGATWQTEGANLEEQYVIQCMQSSLMHQLIEEKTRVYEKLQWMLKRVQEKEQGAQALCVDEHLNKAELKINAIKTRMASCAERYMREEL